MTTTQRNRPSIDVYLRRIVVDTDNAYEMGYEGGRLDLAANLPALTYRDFQSLYGDAPDFFEGYIDAYYDYAVKHLPTC